MADALVNALVLVVIFLMGCWVGYSTGFREAERRAILERRLRGR